MSAPLRRCLSLVLCPLWMAVILVVTGCAAVPTEQLHSFAFDVRTENTDIEVLDYRYGEVKIGPTQANHYSVASGLVQYQAGVTGYMPRGKRLYVKWRIRATGEVREDTVDLESRLPSDISNRIITFNFKEGRLFVYLVTREVLPLGQKSNGPGIYDIYKTHTIYPDSHFNLPR